MGNYVRTLSLKFCSVENSKSRQRCVKNLKGTFQSHSAHNSRIEVLVTLLFVAIYVAIDFKRVQGILG